MKSLELTDAEWSLVASALHTALNSARGRLRYRKSAQGQASSSTPGMDADWAAAEVEGYKQILGKVAEATGQSGRFADFSPFDVKGTQSR